ncbi:MAG: hypothetical protein A2W73_11490 [Deltaproteobacteria bacterium RIFCSPLOWO2_12_55_13]|nr:MAG: hypothetical protein A2W73_11490 [Deltaproteobacteria bacterium RIFCSPLOWO2_12_55_13]
MRLRSVLILTLFVSSILIAPAAFSAIAASAPPRIVFSFAGLNERTGILFVGKDRGFFQKHGLDGQEVFVRSGQLGVTALSAGESQFHVGSANGATIGAMGGGLDIAFIAGLINKLDGYFVVAPHIKSPSDLKGKNIGVQSVGGGIWMFTMLAFEHWGLNPERDNIRFRVIGDQSVLAQALASGIIDGSYLGYTFGSNMERQGFRILDDLAKLGIPYQSLGVMARRSFVDRSPDIAERTMRAIVETISFIQDPVNKAAVMQSLARGLRLRKIEEAEVGYEMIKGLYDRRIYPTVEGLRNVISLLGKTNEKIRRLKAEDIIDDRIVRKLEREGLF